MQREAIMIRSPPPAGWPPAPNPHDTTRSIDRQPIETKPACVSFGLVSLKFRSERREEAVQIWSVSYRGHDWPS
jgi:hypothetical protein